MAGDCWKTVLLRPSSVAVRYDSDMARNLKHLAMIFDQLFTDPPNLWQMAYTEFYFDSGWWPDFSKERLIAALRAYTKRQRRYGGS